MLNKSFHHFEKHSVGKVNTEVEYGRIIHVTLSVPAVPAGDPDLFPAHQHPVGARLAVVQQFEVAAAPLLPLGGVLGEPVQNSPLTEHCGKTNTQSIRHKNCHSVIAPLSLNPSFSVNE